MLHDHQKIEECCLRYGLLKFNFVIFKIAKPRKTEKHHQLYYKVNKPNSQSGIYCQTQQLEGPLLSDLNHRSFSGNMWNLFEKCVKMLDFL